jgi:hypothetical protein
MNLLIISGIKMYRKLPSFLTSSSSIYLAISVISTNLRRYWPFFPHISAEQRNAGTNQIRRLVVPASRSHPTTPSRARILGKKACSAGLDQLCDDLDANVSVLSE